MGKHSQFFLDALTSSTVDPTDNGNAKEKHLNLELALFTIIDPFGVVD